MADTRAAQTNLVVLDDERAVARAAAERLNEALAGAIAARGEAHLVLTGGSSAVALYRELRQQQYVDAVDWARVHLWWGDERLVPVDHPQSNIGLAYNMLLELPARAGESGFGGEATDVDAGDLPALPVRVENVHPYEVDEAFSESEPGQLIAQRYAEEIEQYVPADGDLPAFDVILLGVGPDGHIMSIFPGSRAIRSDQLVVSVPAPEHVEPHIERVSLHPRVLSAAGSVIVMATGSGKAEVLASVLGDKRDPARWPAQLARLPQAVWLLDRQAATDLGRSAQT